MDEEKARKRKTPASLLHSASSGEKKFNPALSLPYSYRIPPTSKSIPRPFERYQPEQSFPPPDQQVFIIPQPPPSTPTKHIPMSYPWTTEEPTTMRNLNDLKAKNLNKISGEVVCSTCGAMYDYELDLVEKYMQVAEFIWNKKRTMYTGAPNCWLYPEMSDCHCCNTPKSVKPVIPEFRDQINWLFLLLGQMLGFCTADQLRYFCYKVYNGLYGAERKDRLLVLTYLGLCKQLDPTGPFDP